MKTPLVRRSRLTHIEHEIAGLRHSLMQNAEEARRRERAARDKVSEQRTDLIASVVADYYRACAALEDRPARRGMDDPFISGQFGVMDQAVTILARLTGKDAVTISFALDAGAPVAGEARMPGEKTERLEALIAPYRQTNAGVYAHLAPERGGPAGGPASARYLREELGLTL